MTPSMLELDMRGSAQGGGWTLSVDATRAEEEERMALGISSESARRRAKAIEMSLAERRGPKTSDREPAGVLAGRRAPIEREV